MRPGLHRPAPLLFGAVLVSLIVGLLSPGALPMGAASPQVGTAEVFPDDNIWNLPVTDLPVHPLSSTYLNNIGLGSGLKADFGAGLWDGGPIGIPYIVVPGSQPKVPIHYTAYGDESDPGPMPIPRDAPVEGGPAGDGDRHILVIDEDNRILYELYNAWPNPDGSWNADSGAAWSLDANMLRPDGWTSADAAGLPIFPGLARYDEVARGAINHALRFTIPRTQRAHLWPARHDASSSTDPARPPMGLRLRLKGSVNIAAYPPQARVVPQALRDYGMILADNGSAMYVSGAPDDRWDNDDLRTLGGINAAMFEAVDVSGVTVSPDSAQTRQSAIPASPTPGQQTLIVTSEGRGSVTPGGGAVATGATATLTATPDAGWLFARWLVDGRVAGYNPTFALNMTTGHRVVAQFAQPHPYPDLPSTVPWAAIDHLAGAGVIRGYQDGTFGLADTTLRAQMAALIARAVGWEDEDWGNGFSDRGELDAALWRNVGALAHYDVARG
ncbi:MAG TPA: S-layer homology domain-containing protein [Thermomicrobiales bacterium]